MWAGGPLLPAESLTAGTGGPPLLSIPTTMESSSHSLLTWVGSRSAPVMLKASCSSREVLIAAPARSALTSMLGPLAITVLS